MDAAQEPGTWSDWRRRVGELYAAVRADEADPASSHDLGMGSTGATSCSATIVHRRYRRSSSVSLPGRAEWPTTTPPTASRCAVDREVEPRDAARWRPAPTESSLRAVRPGPAGRLGSLDMWWLTAYGGGLFLPMRRRLIDDVRRRPLPARHDQGRRPGRRSVEPPGHRPQLRLPALVRLRRGLGVPAGRPDQHGSSAAVPVGEQYVDLSSP